jgi:hypothetical protein
MNVWWIADAAGSESAWVGVARAMVYEISRDDLARVWIAEVTGDTEPTEHPTRFTAKRAATRRLWAVLGGG